MTTMTPSKTAQIRGKFHHDFLSPDGRMLALATIDRRRTHLSFHSVNDGHIVSQFSTRAKPQVNAPFAGQLSGNGSIWTFGDRDGNINLWNTSDGKHLHTYRAYDGSVQDLDTTPGLDSIASVGARDHLPPTRVNFWDTERWQQTWAYQVQRPYEIYSNKMATKGRIVLIHASRERGQHEIQCLDCRQRKPAYVLDLAKDNSCGIVGQSTSFMTDCTINSFDTNRDGRRIVTVNSKKLSVWEVRQQRTLGSIRLSKDREWKNNPVSLTPDGTRAMYGNYTFDLCNQAEPVIMMNYTHSNDSLSSHISADGLHVSIVKPKVVKVYKYDGSGASEVEDDDLGQQIRRSSRRRNERRVRFERHI